jgi:hypothetical protein
MAPLVIGLMVRSKVVSVTGTSLCTTQLSKIQLRRGLALRAVRQSLTTTCPSLIAGRCCRFRRYSQECRRRQCGEAEPSRHTARRRARCGPSAGRRITARRRSIAGPGAACNNNDARNMPKTAILTRAARRRSARPGSPAGSSSTPRPGSASSRARRRSRSCASGGAGGQRFLASSSFSTSAAMRKLSSAAGTPQ